MRSLTPDLIGRRAAVPSLLDKKGISTRLRVPKGAERRAHCSARMSPSRRSNEPCPKPEPRYYERAGSGRPRAPSLLLLSQEMRDHSRRSAVALMVWTKLATTAARSQSFSLYAA